MTIVNVIRHTHALTVMSILHIVQLDIIFHHCSLPLMFAVLTEVKAMLALTNHFIIITITTTTNTSRKRNKCQCHQHLN